MLDRCQVASGLLRKHRFLGCLETLNYFEPLWYNSILESVSYDNSDASEENREDSCTESGNVDPPTTELLKERWAIKARLNA